MAGGQDLTGFPAAPWRLRGMAWAGLFRADRPSPLPLGLRPFVSDRLLALAVVRYREGTLRYDELVLGRPVWYGWRPGVWVESIWVDSEASLEGGREIWALPKQMATFGWAGDRVTVRDEQGVIVTVQVNQRDGWWPAVWLPVPFVGSWGGRSRYTVASLRGWLGRPGMRVGEWPERFGFKVGERPVVGVKVRPFWSYFPRP